MNEQSLKELGQLLHSQRQAAGLSMNELGKKAGVAAATIHRLEQGRFEAPSPQKLQRIAQALGVEVEDYFALAGYFTPAGLPALTPYLRAKYDLPEEAAKDVEQYLIFIQDRYKQENE